jgi:hypothetical protein
VGGQVKHPDVLQPIQHQLHSQRREEEAEDPSLAVTQRYFRATDDEARAAVNLP